RRSPTSPVSPPPSWPRRYAARDCRASSAGPIAGSSTSTPRRSRSSSKSFTVAPRLSSSLIPSTSGDRMNYEQLVEHLAQQDSRIVVMTAENRAAIRNLPATLGDRFIDVGIAEQTLIGAAAGLALRGRIPICHALATFLVLRAFEFIRTDVGIARLPVKLVGGVPGFLSDGNGPTHQAIEDISLI